MQTPLVRRTRFPNWRSKGGFVDQPLGLERGTAVTNPTQSLLDQLKRRNLGSNSIQAKLGRITWMNHVIRSGAVEFQFGVERKGKDKNAKGCRQPPRPELGSCEGHMSTCCVIRTPQNGFCCAQVSLDCKPSHI